MDVIYKIRNKDGMFSNGKADHKKHRWVKKGKIWNSLSLVEIHLHAVCERPKSRNLYDGCDIVSYSFAELLVIGMEPILRQVNVNIMNEILKK